jgi:hypothetical protein
MESIHKQMDESVDRFNAILKPLILRIEEKYQDDKSGDVIYRLRRRLFMALESDPGCALEIVGPFLWEHRDNIMARNEKFFLDFNYLKDEKKINVIEKVEKKGLTILVDYIKKDYKSLSQSDKDLICLDFQSMLIEYTKYLKNSQSLQ